jgi:hypothetical protein
LTRRCSSGDGGSRRGPDRIYMPPGGADPWRLIEGGGNRARIASLEGRLRTRGPRRAGLARLEPESRGQGQRAGRRNCATVWLGRSYSPGLAD